jgi:microcystin-dependent protein
MNKDIIVYSLILILFILIIYLFIKVNQEENSTVITQSTNPPGSNQEIDLSNYYTKNDIDNTFYTKSYVDNIESNLSRDSDGNIFRAAGNQELGYDIEIDNTIRFNRPVDFDHDNHVINTLPRGSIMAWNSSRVPKGWALCDGQSWNLDSNGDAQVDSTGVQTPDLRGRFILGAGQGNGLTNRTLGDNVGGEETHTLNSNEIPPHQHQINLRGGNAGTSVHPHQFRTGDSENQQYTTLLSGGAGQPHNNMPPFYVLTYIMKL